MNTPRLCVAAALAAALAGCSVDEPPSEMKVTVLRYVPALKCWESMTQAQPDEAFPLVEPCGTSAEPGAGFAGGGDQIGLAIDYGPDVQFTPGTTPPTPTITMTLDGVVTPTGGGILDATTDDLRAFFFADFPAPPRAIEEMRFHVEAAQGFSHHVERSFRVDAPEIDVHVEQCQEGTPCELTTGTGDVVAIITVPGTTPVDVTLTSEIGGIPQQFSQIVQAKEPQVVDHRPVMVGKAFPAVPKADDGEIWQLVAQWSSARDRSEEMKLKASEVEIAVGACPGKSCDLTGGVGDVAVTVTVPGKVPADVMLTWTIDGELQSESATIQAKTPEVGAKVSGVTHIDVPVAKEGAKWVLIARYGTSTKSADPITLHQPVIKLDVDKCPEGTSCELTGGVGGVWVEATVPGEAPTDVTLVWTIDGALQPGLVTIDADTEVKGPSGPMVSGKKLVPVPLAPEGAKWVLIAQHGASTTSTSPITLHAPVVDLHVQQCPMMGACSLTGGVGDAVLDLSVPASGPATVTLTWAIDYVLQPGSQTVQLKPPVGSSVATGTAFVKVPPAQDGAVWQLFAEYAGNQSSAEEITILRPSIEAVLTCGIGCVPKAGSKVGLLVTAPFGFYTSTALVSKLVDGVPAISNATLALSNGDLEAGTVSNIMPLTVPSSPASTWQIDTSVGPYKATTILSTIAP